MSAAPATATCLCCLVVAWLKRVKYACPDRTDVLSYVVLLYVVISKSIYAGRVLNVIRLLLSDTHGKKSKHAYQPCRAGCMREQECAHVSTPASNGRDHSHTPHKRRLLLMVKLRRLNGILNLNMKAWLHLLVSLAQ